MKKFSILSAFVAVVMLMQTAQVLAIPPDRAQILVTCPVPGALIFVDHVMVGKAPLNMIVLPGSHEVRVSAGEEYQPYVQNITVATGQMLHVAVSLQRLAPALYRDAMTALHLGNDSLATALFDQAARAPGKRPPDIPFYQGLLAERAHHPKTAERLFLAWLDIDQASATGQYHLGLVREKLHRTALALTAYKSALIYGLRDTQAALKATGPATEANLERLEQAAAASDNDGIIARIQLAYWYELKGNFAEARDRFRALFESIVVRSGINVDLPQPSGLPITLRPAETPSPSPSSAPSDTPSPVPPEGTNTPSNGTPPPSTPGQP